MMHWKIYLKESCKRLKYAFILCGINLHTSAPRVARKKKKFATHIKKRKDNEGAPPFVNDITQEKVEEAKRKNCYNIWESRNLHETISRCKIFKLATRKW